MTSTASTTPTSRARCTRWHGSDRAYEAARAKLAGLVNVPRRTGAHLGTTRRSTCRLQPRFADLRPGEAILLTRMEHHANIVPWQLIASAAAQIRVADITPDGELDLDHLYSR